MPKVLDDLIDSGLNEYTLTEKTKALVIMGLRDSQEFISTCNSRETELKAQIAQLRVEVSQLIGVLRQSQDSKQMEIDAVQEMMQVLQPRKIQ